MRACIEADPLKVILLKRLFRSLDPFELSCQIEEKLERIYDMTFGLSAFQRRTNIPKIHNVNKREKVAKRENYDYSYGYILK